jgi:hypothetical protein
MIVIRKRLNQPSEEAKQRIVTNVVCLANWLRIEAEKAAKAKEEEKK